MFNFIFQLLVSQVISCFSLYEKHFVKLLDEKIQRCYYNTSYKFTNNINFTLLQNNYIGKLVTIRRYFFNFYHYSAQRVV